MAVNPVINAEFTQPIRSVVIMFTDLVDSVGLKNRLGTASYNKLIARHDALFMEILHATAGAELIQDTGDGFYALFDSAADAVSAALRFQHVLRAESWKHTVPQVRIGLHAGQISEVTGTEREAKLVGLPIDLTARLMSLATGGQILMSAEVFDQARHAHAEQMVAAPDGRSLSWMAHGTYKPKGYDHPIEVYEVGEAGSAPLLPPEDTEKARRAVNDEQAELLGWRPAAGQKVPHKSDWLLEKKLGEGSVGEVWVARKTQTEQRHVFKFCFDAERLRSLRRELAFFKLIRHTLGDRSDIAALHDLQLEAPPYYLESEYVPEGDLAHWSERQGGIGAVPMETRLDFFVRTARAVAASHSVGILHKDIKPLNILVALDEAGNPRPRLTDFGIGELKEPKEAPGVTEMGFTQVLVGEDTSSSSSTRLYTPPEMLAGQPFTMQGDVYALGVMLYQMVVGDLYRPLAVGWERDVDDELLRADIARCIDGDLQRRFASASVLAEHIESLEQRRERMLRKLDRQRSEQRRQHFFRIGLVGTGVLLVVIAMVTTAWMREQDLRVTAENETAKVKAVSDFLVSIFEVSDPFESRGDTITAREILDRGAGRIEEELKDQPEVQSELMDTVGFVYQNLGLYHEAIDLFRKSLTIRETQSDTTRDELADSENHLSVALMYIRDFAAAEPHVRKALELDIEVKGEISAEVASGYNNLAWIQKVNGNLEEAEHLFRRAIGISEILEGEGCETCAQYTHNLAQLLQRMGRYPEAEQAFRKSLETRRRLFGEPHPWVSESLYGVADILHDTGRYKEAEALFRKALEMDRTLYGDAHPFVADDMRNLGYLLFDLRRYDEAYQLLTDALAMQESVFGEGHAITASLRILIAGVHMERNELELAEQFAQEAVTIYEQDPETQPTLFAHALTSLGHIANRAQDYQRAEEYFEESLDLLRDNQDAEPRLLANTLQKRADNFKELGRPESGLEPAREAVAVLRDLLPADHPDLNASLEVLAELEALVHH